MSSWSTTVILLTVLAAGACAHQPPITTDLRRAAGTVSIVDAAEIEGRQYRIISEVQGWSCARQVGSDPSMDIAREQLRLETARVGGDAVTNVACREGGTNLARNCWKTIQCVGDAIRFTGSGS